MTDQTHDTGVLANADDLALVQGLADENTDAADLWAEFDEAEREPDDGAAAGDGDSAESDFADGEPGAADADANSASTDGAIQTGAADAAAATPSIWDSAPEDLRTEFQRVQAENARLAQKERSATGRATGFQRRYEDLLKAAQPREVNGDRQSPDAALAALKVDYPEIAGPLEKALGAIQGDVANLSDAEEGRRKAAETELTEFLDEEENSLKSQHPDYVDVLSKNSDRLVSWIDDQPRAVREAFARNANQIVNAAEAAFVISAFKAHLNPPVNAPAGTRGRNPSSLSVKRERQLGSTAAPSGSSRRPTVSGIPEDGDPQAIWDAFDAVEQR